MRGELHAVSHSRSADGFRASGVGRVLLAGDAGGFVNGFTAEGIYYAMVSGDLAARAVLEAPLAAPGACASLYAEPAIARSAQSCAIPC